MKTMGLKQVQKWRYCRDQAEFLGQNQASNGACLV